MTPLSTTYLAYLLLSAYITVVVGHRLHKHGRPFLLEIFLRNATLADSINHLLLVGYYLTNAVLVTRTLTCHVEVTLWADILPVLSSKIGWVMLVLSGMHFFNVAVLLGIRQKIWDTPSDLTF